MLQLSIYNQGGHLQRFPISSTFKKVVLNSNLIGSIVELKNGLVFPCTGNNAQGLLDMVEPTDDYCWVWTSLDEASTDQYDASFNYQLGAKLFCNKQGKFGMFAGPPGGQSALAIVSAIPTAYNPWLGFKHFVHSTNSLSNTQNIKSDPKKSVVTNCIKCNDFNQYAEANQPDGTYKCYRCRNFF